MNSMLLAIMVLLGVNTTNLSTDTLTLQEAYSIVEFNDEEMIENYEVVAWQKSEDKKAKMEESRNRICETDLYRTDLPEDLEQYTIDICKMYGIPAETAFGVMWQESRYTIDILGDNGKAYGLMQIRPEYHQDRMARLGCWDLLDPYQNILVGVDLLAELIREYGSVDAALTYYRYGTIYGSVDYATIVDSASCYILGYADDIVYSANGNY